MTRDWQVKCPIAAMLSVYVRVFLTRCRFSGRTTARVPPLVSSMSPTRCAPSRKHTVKLTSSFAVCSFIWLLFYSWRLHIYYSILIQYAFKDAFHTNLFEPSLISALCVVEMPFLFDGRDERANRRVMCVLLAGVVLVLFSVGVAGTPEEHKPVQEQLPQEVHLPAF